MNDTLSVAAVVILYNPERAVLDNIKSYYPFVKKLFVFDNSETKQPISSDLLHLEKVEFYQDFENAGIAKRLNTAVNLAVQQKYDWLLTMDQDTWFNHNAISTYLKCINGHYNKEQVAAFGTGYGSTVHESLNQCTYEKADNLITSGMMVNLNLVKYTGGFDENLFIDSVDHDYVIKARLHGFDTIKFTGIYIVHSLGKQVYRASIKTLFIVKKHKIIHSPLRCYYMYRNMLYLESKYKNKNTYLAQNLRKIVTGNIMANFFYGRNAWQTFRYLLKAKNDFKHSRMGKHNGEESII